MPKQKKKTNRDNKKIKDELSAFEKIQFLQFEYDWQKQRRSDLVDKAKMFLCWNAAVFAFAIIFTDVEKIVALFNCNGRCFIYVSAVVLVILLIISIIILAISSYGYFECLDIIKINCFEIKDYIDGEFNVKNIFNDYKEIIIDYDEKIEQMAKKISTNIILMIIGITILLVVEMLLKIFVSI